MRVLRSFDPMTLRNEVAVCAALRAAAAAGYTCAVTGELHAVTRLWVDSIA